jgi:thioredoxin:protein disulfide reductase
MAKLSLIGLCLFFNVFFNPSFSQASKKEDLSNPWGSSHLSESSDSSYTDPDDKAVTAKASLTPFLIEPTQNVTLEVELHIAQGYTTYAEAYSVSLNSSLTGFKIGKPHISPIETFYDPTSKKKRQGVKGTAMLKVPLEAPETFSLKNKTLELTLTYQACTQKYCLFPKTLPLVVHFQWSPEKGSPSSQPSASTSDPDPASLTFSVSPSESSVSSSVLDFWTQLKSLDPGRFYEKQGLILMLLALFLLGILTSLTPCIYPLIPITLAVLGRQAHARTQKESFFAANLYVLGMSLTYSILGVVAASSGALFGSLGNSPWILGFVCCVFLLMSLSSFDVFEVTLPSFLQKILYRNSDSLQENSSQNRPYNRYSHYGQVFFSGLVAGLIAGPCVGPILVGILTFISQTQNLVLGFWALFAFAMGMGQLLLIIGLSGGTLKLLPKSGPWMKGIKTLFGVLLLGMFYFYLIKLIPLSWWELTLGLGLILLGSFSPMGLTKFSQTLIVLGSLFVFFSIKTLFFTSDSSGLSQSQSLQFQSLPSGSLFSEFAPSKLAPGESVSSKLSPSGFPPSKLSASESSPFKGWLPYSTETYEEALKKEQPLLIDFYADWCSVCKEIEHKLFAHPRFKKLTENMSLLKFDATDSSLELTLLKKKYGIVGLPTLLFYSKKGVLIPELTLNEATSLEDLERRLKALNQ